MRLGVVVALLALVAWPEAHGIFLERVRLDGTPYPETVVGGYWKIVRRDASLSVILGKYR